MPPGQDAPDQDMLGTYMCDQRKPLKDGNQQACIKHVHEPGFAGGC